MSKNKLLTIPIEQEKRERLNQHCKERGITVSQLITLYIDKVLDDGLDLTQPIEIYRQPIDIDTSLDTYIDNLQNSGKFIALVREIVETATEQPDRVSYNYLESVIEEMDGRLTDRVDLISHQLSQLASIVNNPSPQPIEDSIEESIDAPIEEEPLTTQAVEQKPFTLEDTNEFLHQKVGHNRDNPNRTERITQQSIADHLNCYSYPHPTGKKWTRTEVSKICKMWNIY